MCSMVRDCPGIVRVGKEIPVRRAAANLARIELARARANTPR